MDNKITSSYRHSKGFYDNIMTRATWWSDLYLRIFWQNVDDVEIAGHVLDYIPDDFDGTILDVPLGTAIFTSEKYSRLKHARITGLDYCEDMLNIARGRLDGLNVDIMKGDVAALPFDDESFDIVLSMNGFPVFPDKDAAFSETRRVLKKGGKLLACFYLKGQSRTTDWLTRNILARKGWMTLPFDDKRKVLERLSPYFEIDDFHIKGSMLYFSATKK